MEMNFTNDAMEIEEDVQQQELKRRKVEITMGTWFFDKRVRKKKYISLTGKVYSGSEAVQKARSEKYSPNHPSQLLRAEFIDCMRHRSVESLIQDYSQEESREKLCALAAWGLPDLLLYRYKQFARIYSLFPWQVDCLLHEAGSILAGHRNFIYSAPTSGGKTLVAELLMLRKLSQTMILGDPRLQPRKTIFFIVPFIALAEEKSQYFRQIWQDMNISLKTFHTTQDDGASSKLGEDVELVICTIERGNILINQLLDEKRESQISMIIIDEIHLISDKNRGFLLEVMLTKLLYVLKDSIQIVGMSATLPNIQELANWLQASLYITSYRPVQLDTYVARDMTLYKVYKTDHHNNSNSDSNKNEKERGVVENNEVVVIENNLSNDSLAQKFGNVKMMTTSTTSSATSIAVSTTTSLLQQVTTTTASVASQRSKDPIQYCSGMIAHRPYEEYLPKPPPHPQTTSPPATTTTATTTVTTTASAIIYESLAPIITIPDDIDGFKSLCLQTIYEEKSALVFLNSKKRCEVCATVLVQALREVSPSVFMTVTTRVGSNNPSSAMMISTVMTDHDECITTDSRKRRYPGANAIATATARIVTDTLFQTKSQQLHAQRRLLLDELSQTAAGLCPILSQCIPYGIAYHHAGLTNEERTILENGFRRGAIQLLCTTSTLSAGVNLPAHRVIIRSLQMGDQYLSIASFRQMCGRAGRTGLDSNGEAILLLGNKVSKKDRDYCEYLLTGELDPLRSSLHCGQGGGLEKLLLEMISCNNRLSKESEVMAFLQCSLLFQQVPYEQVVSYVKEAIIFLKKEQFVLFVTPTDHPLLLPSPLGRATTISGITPKDTVDILPSLLQAKRQIYALSTGFHLLYLITPVSASTVASSGIIEPDWIQFENFYQQFLKEYPVLAPFMNELGISLSQIISFRFQKPVISSETYRKYKRVYLTMILFLLLQETVVVSPLLLKALNQYSRGQLQQFQKEITIYAAMIINFCQLCNWEGLVRLLQDYQKKLVVMLHQKEYSELCKIGKEMTFVRAKYFVEKYQVKTAREFVLLGEEKVTEILIEMLPFVTERNVFQEREKIALPLETSNSTATATATALTEEGGGGRPGSSESNKYKESCKRLAQLLIHRANQSMREEMERKLETS